MPGMKDGQPFVGKRIEKVTADDGEDVSDVDDDEADLSNDGANTWCSRKGV